MKKEFWEKEEIEGS